MFLEPTDLAGDHAQEPVAGPASEGPGAGNGKDGLPDERFDHEVWQALPFGVGEADDLCVAVEESVEPLLVRLVGPFFGSTTDGDGELKCAVGDIDDALADSAGIEVEHGYDAMVFEEHVPGVPVGVDDFDGQRGVVEGVDGVGGAVVLIEQEPDEADQLGFLPGDAFVAGHG